MTGMFRIRTALLVAGLGIARPEASAQLSAVKHLSIGAESGPPDVVFGRIPAIALGPSNEVAVVDDQAFDLRVFSADGKLLARAGRGGQGPEEFIAPRAVTILPNGDIAVLDMGNARISIWRRESATLHLIRLLRIDRIGEAMCALHGDIFVDGRGKTVLSRVPIDGQPIVGVGGALIDSFSVPIQRGPLVCAEDQKLIIATRKNQPEVTAFRPDGSVAWRTPLGGFVPIATTPVPPTGLTYSLPRIGYYHAVKSAFLVSPAVVAIQLEKRAGNHEDVVAIETRLLSVTTGAEISSLSTLPLILAWRGTQAAGASDDPFPSVSLYVATVTGGR